ncbi:hypothetical protein SNK03_001857 [Fusarium graminearum]
MSSYCPNKFVSLSFVLSLSSFVRGQTFLKARDGTKLSLGVPETLSEKCQASFHETVECNARLGSVAFNGTFPTNDQLASICTSDCYESLNVFRSKQIQACSNETFLLDGYDTPATFNVDQLLFTYDYTCLRDGKSKAFCLPLIHQWSDKDNGTSSDQSCSECMLRNFQVELNSPFGYDEEFASYYSSLTSSCQATQYPFTSPDVYFHTTTTTAESTATYYQPDLDKNRGDAHHCVMSFPMPASCYATSAKTVPGTWEFPSPTAVQPPKWTETPLAPGTDSDCAAYVNWVKPLRKGSAVNRCFVVADIYEGM